MGALRTCCGLYCSFTALIGIYFFIVLAIMEYRENEYLMQILQKEHAGGDGDWREKDKEKAHMKGTAFLIVAAI